MNPYTGDLLRMSDLASQLRVSFEDVRIAVDTLLAEHGRARVIAATTTMFHVGTPTGSWPDNVLSLDAADMVRELIRSSRRRSGPR